MNLTMRNSATMRDSALMAAVAAWLSTVGALNGMPLAVDAGEPESDQAAEEVVLRLSDGRFLQTGGDGAVRADRLFPTEFETFELLPLAESRIALRAHHGRFLLAEGRDANRLRADSPRIVPDDRETMVVHPLEANRVALRARNFREFIRFADEDSQSPADSPAEQPTPGQTVEIFRAGEVPFAVRSALAMAIQGLAMKELEGEQYDKVDTRKRVKYIELPAPTLRHPKRTKRHRVLSMAEEYHLKAQLDGPLTVQISRMPYLKGYYQRGTGLLLFVVETRVPVRGRVRYVIPGTLSASTGFLTTVRLNMVGEIRAEKSDQQLSLTPPELRQIQVEMRGLDLSNDVLHVVRRQIEDLINRELRKNNDRIRREANEALAKAVEAQEFRHPLLNFLNLP
ncbi:MAG: hypothetical protein JXB62_11655 [Pirellulales bacterium]|nr:hypothetical protein [Pirellulales bacterium]